jgi:PAS domain S-box-containing protein
VNLKLKKNELKGLKEQLKIVSKFFPDGYFLYDLKGKLIEVNKAAEKFLGHKRNELIGKNFLKEKLFFPMQINEAAMRLAKHTIGPAIRTEEISFNREDGSRVALEVRSFLVNIKGKTMVLTIARDITPRKKNVHLLQRSEKKYRTLFESSSDAIMLISKEKKFLQANPAAFKMFGCVNKEELNSLFITDHLSPEQQPDGTPSLQKAEELIGIALEKGSNFFEWKHKRKDGKEFFASVLLTKMELDDEIILQTTIRDITENKLAEESLKKFKAVADQQTVGNAIADPAGNLVYHNKVFAEMHGYGDEKLIGKNLSIFYPENLREKISPLNSMSEWVVKRGGANSEEIWRVRKDGSYFPALMNLTVINKRNGNPLCLAVSVINISERKKAEEELKIKTHRLEELNTALNVLLQKRDEDKKRLEEGMLSNVKQLIEPYVEKLKKSLLDERQKVYVSIIEKNLKDLISPFLRTLSSKYLHLTPTELEVAHLIRQGRNTKEIAEVLSISPLTVVFHRNNIRKKLGLRSKKDNLRTHLLSLQ